MGYAEQNSIEPDHYFTTPSGLLVKTTGYTEHIDSRELYVHEVEIVEGPGAGKHFLLNLDHAEPAAIRHDAEDVE